MNYADFQTVEINVKKAEVDVLQSSTVGLQCLDKLRIGSQSFLGIRALTRAWNIKPHCAASDPV